MLENSLLLLVAALLVLLNGFFVAAEFGMVKLRSTRVAELRRIGGWRGRALSEVHRQLDTYLSACQLGITLASLGLGWIGEPAFAHLIEQPMAWLGLDQDRAAVEAVAFIVAFTLISFLHIVIGELAPKSLALRRAETVSMWTAAPLMGFYWLMYPFIVVLNASANLTLRLAGLGRPGDASHETPHSLEELRVLLHRSRASAATELREINVLASHALELPALTPGELMRPWRELVSIQVGQSPAEVRALVRQHRYSRYPLLDRQGNVLGVLHVKDLMLEAGGDDYDARIQRGLHQPLLTSEDDSAADLLRSFRRGASHFAIVMDAQLRPAGFLTLEDVLEAMLGEITDEHEAGRPQQVQRRPIPLKDGGWLARGDTPIYLMERELGQPIPDSDAVNTLGGLLMQHLDRLPVDGDAIELGNVTIQALRMDGKRVETVKVQRGGYPPPTTAD